MGDIPYKDQYTPEHAGKDTRHTLKQVQPRHRQAKPSPAPCPVPCPVHAAAVLPHLRHVRRAFGGLAVRHQRLVRGRGRVRVRVRVRVRLRLRVRLRVRLRLRVRVRVRVRARLRLQLLLEHACPAWRRSRVVRG